MAESLVGIELDNGGMLVRYVKTAVETGGVLHAQEARYPARSSRPPSHRHPKQVETFSIVEGALCFRISGEERTVSQGQEVVVPQGAFHQVHNPSDQPALAIWETRPALRTAEFFLAMNRAMKGGKAKPRLRDAAAILSEYRDEFQLEKPPLLVQRIVFGCLAPFGRSALSGGLPAD
jgi:mannose-6-phosphate isomerase-like protein (cupin superfamily)